MPVKKHVKQTASLISKRDRTEKTEVGKTV